MRVRCASCMPRATPGCGGRGSPPASTAPRSCGRRASTTSWRCASTASSPRRKGCAANRRPTRSWPLPEDSASSRPLRRCSRTRSRGSPPAVPATSGTSSAWTGSARRSTYAGTGPMWWWPTSTTSWPSHDHASGVCRRALGDPRNGHRPRRPAQTESVFALSNGHIGLRGNLDEGEPHGLPGTYLNSVYEDRPLPYTEAGYGFPPVGQTVINVTNGKLIRLLVEDEPFDVRSGELRSHERVLSLRDGVLRRNAVWTSPSGDDVEVCSTRLVSFTQRGRRDPVRGTTDQPPIACRGPVGAGRQ